MKELILDEDMNFRQRVVQDDYIKVIHIIDEACGVEGWTHLNMTTLDYSDIEKISDFMKKGQVKNENL